VWIWIYVLPLLSGVIGFIWFWVHTGGRPLAWIRVQLGWGRGIAALASFLDMDPDKLVSMSCVYRDAFIPKRSGGVRRLRIPDADLKLVQRCILRRLLARTAAHAAATAYERGKSIVDNARPHVAKMVVIKLDLVDFFPSCPAERIDRLFRWRGWNREAAALLTRLCTCDGGLPQGAPTSPRLSNLLLKPFDIRLDGFVQRRKGAYTRYADDITISFPRDYPKKIRGVIQYVRRLAKAFGLQVHVGKKLRVLRRHKQQRVTGLVVNERLNVPRRLRRRLRAIAHHHKTGRKVTMTEAQLEGWRGYVAMIRAASGAAPPQPS
jgi:RNA-directed DNA polymerase